SYDAAGNFQRALDPGQGGAVAGFAFGPDGSLAAVTYADGRLRVWDVAGGGVRFEANGEVHDGGGPVFLPDGRRVVALVRGAVRVWDVAERAERAAVEYPADGDSRPKRFLLAARADGKLLAVAGLTDIQLFDPDAGTFVGRLPRPDAGPAAFPEGAMAF